MCAVSIPYSSLDLVYYSNLRHIVFGLLAVSLGKIRQKQFQRWVMHHGPVLVLLAGFGYYRLCYACKLAKMQHMH